MNLGLTRLHARPPLLPLTYVSSIALVVVALVGLVTLATEHARATAIGSVAVSDQVIARSLIDEVLRPAAPPGTGNAATVTLEQAVAELVDGTNVLGLSVRSASGQPLASRGAMTPEPSDGSGLAAAFGGEAAARLVEGGARPILVTYQPILVGQRVVAVIEVHRDATQLLAYGDALRRDLILGAIAGVFVLTLLLRAIFRAAQERLATQAALLLEKARRDPLTNVLGHGAAVETLTASVDAARTHGAAVDVALVDIDNFRLLNETHGHAAGDKILRLVAQTLERELAHATIGRLGPDEFMVIDASGVPFGLEGGIEVVRDRLHGMAVQVGSSERLPVTVSAGICSFPRHGDAATELLSEATVALGEAKASGGDAVRTAAVSFEERHAAPPSSFDILEGLVLAVDTKDRYTKRHSDDVSRYATFLAVRARLDQQLVRTIELAGRLHDIGKIGIPDAILRKPGPLTTHEYDIVKQHVALGELIVRDLPNLWLVRAGIRHHHERWDGTGYLDRLAGDRIPLIGRVLAVADAFSAMTTTRPYRKALSFDEAMERLREAAGTQLDPELVSAFIEGMLSVPGAPRPQAAPKTVTSRVA